MGCENKGFFFYYYFLFCKWNIIIVLTFFFNFLLEKITKGYVILESVLEYFGMPKIENETWESSY